MWTYKKKNEKKVKKERNPIHHNVNSEGQIFAFERLSTLVVLTKFAIQVYTHMCYRQCMTITS